MTVFRVLVVTVVAADVALVLLGCVKAFNNRRRKESK